MVLHGGFCSENLPLGSLVQPNILILEIEPHEVNSAAFFSK